MSTQPTSQNRDIRPRTAMRGLPTVIPANVATVGHLAEQHGWTVNPTHTSVPKRTIVLRFGRPGAPSIWALWSNGYYDCGYARTAQRLSFGDLKAVLVDPSLLEQDLADPFGHDIEDDAVPA